MEGSLGKKRFTVRFPFSNQLLRLGDCNPSNEDRADIVKEPNRVFLVFYPKEGYHLPETGRMLLPIGTQITLGWYENEWEGWVDAQNFEFK